MKNSDSTIIKNMETCINNIDESLTITINLVYSPYNEVFETEINKWNSNVFLVSEVLEKWLKLQMNYM